ncbi:MAG TPA: leucine-rich repeat domain-containing protein [Bacteroidales bacterium]|nr:leucine-rich repeat domain-containing protein [Bacteroidales bacterium]
MAQGDIKVLQEDAGVYKEINLRVSSVKSDGSGLHTVRYFDPFGALLSTQKIATGQNATPPTPPTLSLLTFHSWNHNGQNITRNEDIGAIYNTTDGLTYIFIHVNSITGLQPTIFLIKSTAAQMTINWGHGDNSLTSASGNISIQKPTAYTAGNYTITIQCAQTYNFGHGTIATTLFGDTSSPYTSITKRIYFGANTTWLAGSVFHNHFGINAIIVSSTIAGSIGSSAFRSCTSLPFIALPSVLTGSIGANVFSLCSFLWALSLPSGMTGSLGLSAFESCGMLQSLTLPSGMTGSLGSYTFAFCNSLIYLSLSSGFTGSIGAFCFDSCTALRMLTFPSGITGNIGTNAFRNCYSLIMTLPSGMTGSIEANGLRACYQFTSLVLPSGLGTAIGDSSFLNMKGLLSLTIPAVCTSVAANAFATNDAINEYIFQSTTPPALAATSAFTGIRLWTRIYVPDASVAAYKAATNWSTYANYIYSINSRP